MNKLFINASVLFLLLGTVSAAADDQIIFAYQVSRHGASNGMPGQPDVLSGQSQAWIPGELSKIGRRQEYLAGYKLRQQYWNNSSPFLGPSYEDTLIEIRSQGNNRSTESAQAFMYGLYPAETNQRHLNWNQTSHAKPQIKISDDILEEVQTKLQLNALPFNTQLYSVTSVEDTYDTMLPVITCKYVRNNNYLANQTQAN